MFLKAMAADLRLALRKTFVLYIIAGALLLLARLVLTFSNAVASSGKPPALCTAVSYIAYFGVLFCCVVIFSVNVAVLKRALIPPSGELYRARHPVIPKLLTAALLNLAAYALFFGGYFFLAAGGSYFEYLFSGLIPPLAYDVSTYGLPFVLFTALSSSVVLVSLPCIFFACFAFAARFRRHNIPAIAAFLVLYTVILILFLCEVLSDFPTTEWFTYSLKSGNYAASISGYLALAIAFLPVGIASCFLSLLFVRHANAPASAKKDKSALSKRLP